MDRIDKFNFRPEGKICIESLVQANGNWKVVYAYNNWGDSILFLLPNFQIDDDEDDINLSVIEAADDTCEINMLIDQFIQQHPTLPFMIRGKSITHCVTKMESKLEAYYGNFDSFVDDSETFDRWRKTIHYIMNDGRRFATNAYHIGWEAVYAIMKEENHAD